jgi:hypothetical protein
MSVARVTFGAATTTDQLLAQVLAELRAIGQVLSAGQAS